MGKMEKDSVDLVGDLGLLYGRLDKSNVLPVTALDPLPRLSHHVGAQLDAHELSVRPDARPDEGEAQPRAAAHVQDNIAWLQAQPGNGLATDRLCQGDSAIVGRGMAPVHFESEPSIGPHLLVSTSETHRYSLPERPEGDAHAVLGLGVLDARLHGGDIVRLWTIPVSVSLDAS